MEMFIILIEINREIFTVCKKIKKRLGFLKNFYYIIEYKSL